MAAALSGRGRRDRSLRSPDLYQSTPTIRGVDEESSLLRSIVRPSYEEGQKSIRIVDMFAGCGGLTLGLAEAARELELATEVPLALDFDETPAAVFRHNFPKANVISGRVEDWFDGPMGGKLTARESRVKAETGAIDMLIGGPPCQGHSDLNNHTRRDDPKNHLYLRMARAAEVLEPRVVVVENVPMALRDRGNVVGITCAALTRAGFEVADGVIDLGLLGVPQTRKRHLLLAVRHEYLDPREILDELGELSEARSLRWAIGDLEDSTSLPLDVPGRISPDNEQRIAYLFDQDEDDLPNSLRPRCHQGNHSYRSMYGRMQWGKPAQTITSGFGSMGQGRFVHPSRPRTITPHEAARIQYFPDWFDFTAGGLETRRGAWATMIGNAVPPKLTLELGRILLPQLVG